MPLALPALSAVVFNEGGRYTGQQLGDDTGLYFYNSRYYDPQLARFIQADTIVPSADTSQALNRYAYVKNNPLKFTDPSGHDWFKKWIGAILTIALTIIAPWGSGFWAMVAYSAIGSAVSTAVNGGNWKSFAIGVGIGIAAAGVADAVGGFLAGGGKAWGEALKASGWAGLGARALSATIMGATSGAISSAVYGQNVGKGMLNGMQAGMTGFAVGIGAAISRPLAEIVTSATIETIKWVAAKAVQTVVFVAQKTLEVISFATAQALKAAKITLWVAGEVWNSPNNAIGLAYGYAGVLLGGDSPVYYKGGLHFPNSPIQFERAAVTFGNVSIYGKGKVYNDNGELVPTYEGYRDHEISHMPQGKVLGPSYVPLHIIDKITELNLLEKGPYSIPHRSWPWK